MVRARVDLPQPDSPTRPKVSPLEDLEGDAVHGADGLPLAGEGHVEITDFK